MADHLPNDSTVIQVAIDGLTDNKLCRHQAGEIDIIVCRWQGRYFAFANRCSHAAQPLHQGRVRQGALFCPHHGARFDLVTGNALSAPAVKPITRYNTRVVGEYLEVVVPNEALNRPSLES